MITIMNVKDLPYPTKCYGCGKRNENGGIRIEVSNPARLRGEVIYLCDKCRQELKEKI